MSTYVERRLAVSTKSRSSHVQVVRGKLRERPVCLSNAKNTSVSYFRINFTWKLVPETNKSINNPHSLVWWHLCRVTTSHWSRVHWSHYKIISLSINDNIMLYQSLLLCRKFFRTLGYLVIFAKIPKRVQKFPFTLLSFSSVVSKKTFTEWISERRSSPFY